MPKAKRRGQGEGSLEQLPSGKWRAVFTNGKKPDGGQRKISCTFDTRKEAHFWLSEQLDAKRWGCSLVPSAMTLDEWVKRWLKGLQSRVERANYKVYSRYGRALLPHLGDAELGQLSPLLIEQALGQVAETGASRHKLRKVLRILRTCLKTAKRLRLIFTNPADDVSPPRKSSREMHCWDKDAARKFLGACKGHRLYPLFLLALDTGLRKGEVLGLSWNDVDFVEGAVQVRRILEEIDGEFTLKDPKTEKSRRRIWVGEFTLQALREHRNRMARKGRDTARGPVFLNMQGEWISGENLRQTFNLLIRKAGVPVVRFHDLRHTSATLLLQTGVGIKTVSERLGHSDVGITLAAYTHVLPGEQKQVGRVADRVFGGPVSHEHPTGEIPRTNVHDCTTNGSA